VAPPKPSRSEGADEAASRAAAVLAELVQSLHDESDALVAGDIDALARAVERKDRALRDLAPQLRLAGSASLLDAVRGARDANRQNAKMLAAHSNFTRARIAALLGASHAAPLYAADGRAAGNADPRPAARGVSA